MSSTILYLAIVVIWAGVLVPRWLRREPHHEASSRARRSAGQASKRPETLPDGVADGFSDWVAGEHADDPASTQLPDPAGGADAGMRDAPYPGDAPPGDTKRSPGRVPSLAHVIAARRRLFAMLALLLAGAAAIAVAGLAAWWIVLPPACMLAGYVALLREAARADAALARARGPRYASERLRRTHVLADGRSATGGSTAVGSAARGSFGSVAGAAAGALGSGSQADTAQVIDLTQRVDEEIYDQYADAKLRAVGD